jgi:hypothetical protein
MSDDDDDDEEEMAGLISRSMGHFDCISRSLLCAAFALLEYFARAF